MKLCRHCNAQFSDEFATCVHCGRRLGPASVEESGATGPDDGGLVHLTDDHPAKIAPLLDRLTAAGISFTLTTDSGVRSVNWKGSSGQEASASVYVGPDDLEPARALHRQFLEDLIPHLAGMHSPVEAAADTCPGCHEPLPAAAESCVACGLEFPDDGEAG